MKFNDFSGISYHLSTPDEGRLDQLRLSIHWECWAQLVQYGAMDVLEREYGPWIASPPEEGYDFTLEFNVDGLVRDDDPGTRTNTVVYALITSDWRASATIDLHHLFQMMWQRKQ